MTHTNRLLQRNGIYHVRVVCPDGEVQRSLHTRCPQEARRLSGLLDYHTPPMPERQQTALRELYRLLLAEHTAALLEDRDSVVDVDDIPPEVDHLYIRLSDAATDAATEAVLDMARGTGHNVQGTTTASQRGPQPCSELLSNAFLRVRSDKLSTGTWTQKTANSASTKLQGFLHAAGDRPWDTYTKADVRSWRDALDVQPATVNNQIAILASVLSWLIQQEDAPHSNPFDGMRLKTVPTGREAFTVPEAQHMLDVLTGWKQDAIRLSLYTGMRVSEVCQLTPDDIVEVDGIRCYKLDPTRHALKTAASARLVPIHPELKDIQLPLGKTATQVGNWFSRTGRAALGVPDKKVLHSTRMYFCLQLLRADVTEETVAQLAGHSYGKTQSFKVYAKEGFALGQLHEAVLKLPVL